VAAFPSTAFLLTSSAIPSFCSSAENMMTAGAAGLRIRIGNRARFQIRPA
jgi:hypothetical protein